MCCSASWEVMDLRGCQDSSVDSRRKKSDQSFMVRYFLSSMWATDSRRETEPEREGKGGSRGLCERRQRKT